MKEKFPKLYNAYRKNILKHSLAYSALINGIIFAISSLLTFVFVPQYFIIPVIVLIVGTTLLTLYFYNKYQPNDYNFSKMLDSLGLKQRVITMKEYENDNSLIARIQRENAIKHINTINESKLVTPIKLSIILLLIVVFMFGFSGITVSALSNSGVIDSGKDLILENIPGLKNEFEVLYDVDGEGYIEGDFFQIITEGKDASEVYAVADEGWFFIGWSDGLQDPYRCDLNIKNNIHITALFGELEKPDDELEFEPIFDPDLPFDEDKQLIQGNKPGDELGNGAGGKYEDNNQVIDGQTFYGDNVFNMAYQDAIETMRQNGSMSDEFKSYVDRYYGIIKK